MSSIFYFSKDTFDGIPISMSKTTVRVKLHSLTNRKVDLLVREYEAFQTEVHSGDANLYSATDHQASKVQRRKVAMAKRAIKRKVEDFQHKLGRVNLSMIPPDGVGLQPRFRGLRIGVAETV